MLLKFKLAALHSCNLTDIDLKQHLIPSGSYFNFIILAVQEMSETRQSQKQDNMVQLTTEQRVFVVTNFI